MAQSRAEIQKRSNEKRGVRPKSYVLDEATIALIDHIAATENRPKGAIMADMATLYAQSKGITILPTDK